MDFEKSRTFANLMAAFAGESQAATKYRIYEEQAKHNGYQHIAYIFNETARNEQAHAQVWLGYIYGGQLPDTLRSLTDAAQGEHYEWSEMYKKFAEDADAEGYKDIATKFRLVANVESWHENRYNGLVDDMKNQQVYKKPNQVSWICRNCGYIYTGTQAPNACPICAYPQAYFEEKKG